MWSPQKGPTRLWDLRFSVLFILQLLSVSPGAVRTEIMGENVEFPSDLPALSSEDVADAVVYCIQTPPNVQIHELTIKPVGEMF